jgi:hypothetical protein
VFDEAKPERSVNREEGADNRMGEILLYQPAGAPNHHAVSIAGFIDWVVINSFGPASFERECQTRWTTDCTEWSQQLISLSAKSAKSVESAFQLLVAGVPQGVGMRIERIRRIRRRLFDGVACTLGKHETNETNRTTDKIESEEDDPAKRWSRDAQTA